MDRRLKEIMLRFIAWCNGSIYQKPRLRKWEFSTPYEDPIYREAIRELEEYLNDNT